MGKLVKVLKFVLVLAAYAVNPLLGAVVTVGMSILEKALQPKRTQISAANRDRLFSTIDPRAPRKIVFGSTALANDVRYEEWYGTDQEFLSRIICVASHKIQSIDEIWIEDQLAWSLSGGVQSAYSGYLWVDVRTEGTSANTIAINGGAKWGATRRLTGCAYIHIKFKTTGNSKKTNSPFATTIPSRLTIKGRGALLYDPRQDSTAGGSGTMRANDQSTWAWTSDAMGNNPALQGLYYFLGWKIANKLAVGQGIPAIRIIMSSFIAGGNICEEAVTLAAGGTEQRYKAAGLVTENDAPTAVLENLTSSCAGTIRDAEGKLSFSILVNDLAVPTAAFTDDDVLGAFQWEPTPAIDQVFNEVRGGYTDPSDAALFQVKDYPPVRLSTVDGIERVHTFDLGMVQSASQAQRLAKQELQRAQYPGVFRAEYKFSALKCGVGNVISQTLSALGWSAKLFRVIEQTIRMDGTVSMTLREESAAIYAWSAEESPAVTPMVPTIYDWTKAPLIAQLATIETGATANPASFEETFVNTSNFNDRWRVVGALGGTVSVAADTGAPSGTALVVSALGATQLNPTAVTRSSLHVSVTGTVTSLYDGLNTAASSIGTNVEASPFVQIDFGVVGAMTAVRLRAIPISITGPSRSLAGTYTASSNYSGSYSGLSNPGLYDAAFNTYASTHATNGTATENTVTFDYGSDVYIEKVQIAPITSLDGFAPKDLDGAIVETQPDAGGAWTRRGVAGVAPTGRTNYVTNALLPTDTTYWFALANGAARVAGGVDDPFAGFIRFSPNAGSGYATHETYNHGAALPNGLNFRYWLRSATSGKLTVFDIDWYNSSGGYISFQRVISQNTPSNVNEWTPIDVAGIDPPAGAWRYTANIQAVTSNTATIDIGGFWVGVDAPGAVAAAYLPDIAIAATVRKVRLRRTTAAGSPTKNWVAVSEFIVCTNRWGAETLNGALLDYSADNNASPTNWTNIGTLSGFTEALGTVAAAVTARHLRIRSTATRNLGVSEFYAENSPGGNVEFRGPAMPISDGQIYELLADRKCLSGTLAGFYVGATFYDGAGAVISTLWNVDNNTALTTTRGRVSGYLKATTGSAVQPAPLVTAPCLTPSGARSVAMAFKAPVGASVGLLSMKAHNGQIASEAGADVTSTQQVSVELIPTKYIPTDYLGVPASGVLAAVVFSPIVKKNGASIRLLDSTTYALSSVVGGTAAVNNTNGSGTKGDITFSAMTASSITGLLTVTVAGVAQAAVPFELIKIAADAPGATSKKVTTNALSQFSSTSYATIASLGSVTVASGESLYGTGTVDFTIDGTTAANRTGTFMYQYESPAATWNDFTTAKTSTVAESRYSTGGLEPEWLPPVPGTVDTVQTKATPGAGTYAVRLVAKLDATGRTATPTTAAVQVEGKV